MLCVHQLFCLYSWENELNSLFASWMLYSCRWGAILDHCLELEWSNTLYSTLLVNVYSLLQLGRVQGWLLPEVLSLMFPLNELEKDSRLLHTAPAALYLRNDSLCILERDMGNILRCLSWVIFEKRLSLHPGCSIDEEDIKKLYWKEIKAILSKDGKNSPTPPQEAWPHPREGYNYYITCYLGNITVDEIWATFLDVA